MGLDNPDESLLFLHRGLQEAELSVQLWVSVTKKVSDFWEVTKLLRMKYVLDLDLLLKGQITEVETG